MYLLEQMQETVGDKGLFAQHLQNKDNGSVFYWLAMWADEEQQETFRTLLTDIHDTQVKGWEITGEVGTCACLECVIACSDKPVLS